ncbi:MAG: restriction endonuclease subunit S [Prevotella sp.]|nr:restriction endonuclease subunit S [Prevotella sp.]
MAREFKDSGIEWIGQIPKEWEVRRIKSIFTERTELSENGDETLLSVSEYYGVANRKDKIEDGEFVSRAESLVGYKKCYEGDLVSNIMLAWKGSLGVTDIDGIVSPAYCVYKPSKEIFPHYYHYLFRTSLFTSIFRLFSKGIIDSRLRLYSPYFYAISTLFPPLPEQQKIACYLDKVCGEVDEMVTLQETMIEELKAYKQSVITEAVTKGLNPNAPMRNSGIDWIGNIPKHWQMKRLKFMCEIQTGNQDTQDAEQDGEYPFYVRSPKVEHSNKYSFEGEGILMAGDGAGAGRVFHHAFGKYAVHQRVYRLSSFENIDTTFLFHYISNLFCKVMDMGSAQSTVPSVRLPMLQNFVVCIPSIEEQQHIATYLDTQCSEIDALITLKQAKIEELKEYKKSVIYEYVTGKKEVV